eukprot:521648_1
MNISIINAEVGINTIFCYTTNACDDIHIITNNQHTQVFMYQYSKNVIIDNGLGYNDTIQNIKCSNEAERRWFKVTTDRVRTNEEMTKISRNCYESNALPCEDVTILCGDFQCHMKYRYNISAETIVQSEYDCLWMELNRATQVFCDGSCPHFEYYNHTINIRISIDFSQITNNTNLCVHFFGDKNSTEKSVANVRGITEDALGIYYQTEYDWQRYVLQSPNASFVTSIINDFQYYLLCNDTITDSKTAKLLVIFKIYEIHNDGRKVQKKFDQGSQFYIRLHSLLTNFFGNANIFITTEVIQNIIQNITPIPWYEEIISIYSFVVTGLWLTLGSFGFLHQKCAKSEFEMCCWNRICLCRPVNSVNFVYFNKYYAKVTGNIASVIFIYELVAVLLTEDFRKNWVLTVNVIFATILTLSIFMSYFRNGVEQWLMIKQQPQMYTQHNWMEQNRWKVFKYLAISGSVQKTHLLISCKLFGMSTFCCDVNPYERCRLYHAEIKYVLPRVLVELILQTASVITIKYHNMENMTTFTYSALLSILLSICNLGVLIHDIVLEHRWQKNQAPNFMASSNHNNTQNYYINRENVIYNGMNQEQFIEEYDEFDEKKQTSISSLTLSSDNTEYGSNRSSVALTESEGNDYWRYMEENMRNASRCDLCKVILECCCGKHQNDIVMFRLNQSISSTHYPGDM